MLRSDVSSRNGYVQGLRSLVFRIYISLRSGACSQVYVHMCGPCEFPDQALPQDLRRLLRWELPKVYSE